jgi:hypothetical protein
MKNYEKRKRDAIVISVGIIISLLVYFGAIYFRSGAF